MFSMLGKIAADNILKYIPCKLSLLKTICLICQSLQKTKQDVIDLSSAEFTLRVVKVKLCSTLKVLITISTDDTLIFFLFFREDVALLVYHLLGR